MPKVTGGKVPPTRLVAREVDASLAREALKASSKRPVDAPAEQAKDAARRHKKVKVLTRRHKSHLNEGESRSRSKARSLRHRRRSPRCPSHRMDLDELCEMPKVTGGKVPPTRPVAREVDASPARETLKASEAPQEGQSADEKTQVPSRRGGVPLSIKGKEPATPSEELETPAGSKEGGASPAHRRPRSMKDLFKTKVHKDDAGYYTLLMSDLGHQDPEKEMKARWKGLKNSMKVWNNSSAAEELERVHRGTVFPLGATTILITFGGEPKSKTLMVSFMVVKLPSAYNAIIRRSTLNRLKAVVSTYHRILKFPTRVGVDEVRSDPRESRQCYLIATTSLRTLASTGDGGPEDAPEELTSGSHRLVSPDPGEETTLTLLEESEEVISTCSK
ncbi:hypothetical protein GW17_00032029 [Ensete ventricosum]|nr:hypothetical protein GW17_00032029 [Ensete ventricosum]